MDKITYKGHRIFADPYPQADDFWQINFYIYIGTGPSEHCWPYLLPVKCHSQEDAIEYCHRAARKIIDEITEEKPV